MSIWCCPIYDYSIYAAIMDKKWQIFEPDIVLLKKICKSFNLNPVTAAVLINRNIVSKDEVSRFIDSPLSNMRPPFSIKDMDKAVDRIVQAILNREKILVFGDYDVDGITATAIIVEFLQYAGTDISYYIPHRANEGYSLQPSHITRYALPNNINLIITVDCGSSSHDAVSEAQKAGIDVVITDHHRVTDNLPEAIAIINPECGGCHPSFNDLAGAGVAFYLVISLRKQMREIDFWKDKPEPNLKNLCDLVALGTVADIVPLLNENRILVRAGLDVINSGRRQGIKALMQSCNIVAAGADSDDIAFKLAPRLNAAGRIDHAKEAVELLLTTSKKNAERIAASLCNKNLVRQEIEKSVFDEIIKYLNNNCELLKQKTLVLADDWSERVWHEGVLGIVAARLVRKFFKPVVLITIQNGIGKGSARSIPAFDIYSGLSACSDDCVSFGGHSMAAGLTIRPEKIDALRKKFEITAQKTTEAEDFVPVLPIDYELNFDDITDKLINELDSLKPFGSANREPLFMARNVKVSFSKIVGKNHRQMLLRQPDAKTDRPFNAINFNIDTSVPFKESFDQIAFRLRWNRWKGSKTVQLIVEDT